MRNPIFVSLVLLSFGGQASIVAGAVAELSGNRFVRDVAESDLIDDSGTARVYSENENNSQYDINSNNNNNTNTNASESSSQLRSEEQESSVQRSKNINKTKLGDQTTNVTVYGSSVAYTKDNGKDGVLEAEDKNRSASHSRIAIMPMLGSTGYSGAWYDHISNSATLGVAMDLPMSPLLSTEIEATYASYRIAYSGGYNHSFNQYGFGANLKAYLWKGYLLRPYAGVGLLALDYDGMRHGPAYDYLGSYNQWIGAGQLMVGAEVGLSHEFSMGLRASYILPLFNRPETASNGVWSAPYYEEATAINTSFYRLMLSLKIAL